MDSVHDPSRRELLERAGLLAVGALGANALHAGSASPALADPGAATERTIVLLGTEWHHRAPDEEERDTAKHGDRLTMSGILLSKAGEQRGVFRGTSYFIDGAFAGGAEDACMELHTFALAEGTLMGFGVFTWADSAFSVIGGTGVYAGARGTYIGRQSPLELGGDGTAEFTFRLT